MEGGKEEWRYTNRPLVIRFIPDTVGVRGLGRGREREGGKARERKRNLVHFIPHTVGV